MLRVIVILVALLCFVPGLPPADAQQRFTQNPISLQRAAGADGDGSAITTKGYLSVALQVTGTFTATVNFEGTADASTWVALKCVNVATDSRTTTLTAAGMVQCNVQGMSSLRARVSGWSNGTVTVTGYLMDVVLGSTSGGSSSGGGTEFNEDTAHTTGDAGKLMLGVRNDSGATTLSDTNGDYTPLAVDSLGRLFIVQTSIAPGTAAGHLGKAEDAAHSSGDTGVMSLCVRRDTAATSATTDGDYNPCATDASGRMWTNTELPDVAALADGTSNPTTTGVAAYNMCFNGTTWDRCTGTSTLHYATSAASTNATNIKASAGTVSVISLVNTTATLYYLRMYNLASAPTCSSATGFVNTIPVPASTSGAGIVIPITVPHAFTTGIGYCLTGGGGSTDNTNAATGVYINIWYK